MALTADSLTAFLDVAAQVVREAQRPADIDEQLDQLSAATTILRDELDALDAWLGVLYGWGSTA